MRQLRSVWVQRWPRDGVPANPCAWLVSAGRFKAIDAMRRRARFDALDDFAGQAEALADEGAAPHASARWRSAGRTRSSGSWSGGSPN